MLARTAAAVKPMVPSQAQATRIWRRILPVAVPIPHLVLPLLEQLLRRPVAVQRDDEPEDGDRDRVVPLWPQEHRDEDRRKQAEAADPVTGVSVSKRCLRRW